MMGNRKWVMIRPPIKKPMVAMREGNCRLAKPVMACPEVQPPAHLVPKPTRNPPAINITTTLTEPKF